MEPLLTCRSVGVQVTKYPQRNGIAGKDLLRLAHPKAADLGKRKREEEVDSMNLVLHYAVNPETEVRYLSLPSLNTAL
jgi:hypothetical protein